MKCNHCGSELTRSDFCPGCGANVLTYKRLQSLSNVYYNDGLEKAQVRNLSGAQSSLRQSLKFNKNQIDARNLLGLVYFEMGEVVSAMSEWVISKNLQPEDNVADEYINMLRTNPGNLELLNQSVKKYNIALKLSRKGSTDMAVIQLNKVLGDNPGFVRARQLLGLLYLNRGEYAKAEKEMHRCLKIDNGSTISHKYLQEARTQQEPGEVENKPATSVIRQHVDGAVREYRSGNETIIQPIHSLVPRGAVSMMSVALGILLGIAAAVYLILPSRVSRITTESQQRITQISEESDAKSAKLQDYESQVEAMKSEQEELQTQIEELAGTSEQNGIAGSLMSAAAAYLTDPEDIETIAESLEPVTPASLEEAGNGDLKKLYQSLVTLVGPQLAERYYKSGYDAYKAEEYETAVTQLTLCCQYDSDNKEAWYYLGNSQYKLGNNDEAKKIFDRVVRDFPGTRTANSAEAKLAEINNADQ